MPSYAGEIILKLREECFLDLGIDPALDREAALEVSELAEKHGFRQNLPDLWGRGNAAIFGPAPYVVRDISGYGLKIVADSGISRFLVMNSLPDVIVTDLDGPLQEILFCQRNGSFLFVHVHGDNLEKVKSNMPLFGERTLFTCQSTETYDLFDFGGFTDGDRSAFIADHYRSESITIYGFRFDNPVPKPFGNQARKLKKLRWARRFLEELAKQRNTSMLEGEVISL